MEYICGIYMWSIYMEYIYGVYRWSIHVEYIGGACIWSMLYVAYVICGVCFLWSMLPPVSIGVFLERLQNHSHDRHYGFNDTKLQCCLKEKRKNRMFKRFPLGNTMQQWFFSTADLKKWHLLAEAQESDGVAFALQATSSSRPTWPREN